MSISLKIACWRYRSPLRTEFKCFKCMAPACLVAKQRKHAQHSLRTGCAKAAHAHYVTGIGHALPRIPLYIIVSDSADSYANFSRRDTYIS